MCFLLYLFNIYESSQFVSCDRFCYFCVFFVISFNIYESCQFVFCDRFCYFCVFFVISFNIYESCQFVSCDRFCYFCVFFVISFNIYESCQFVSCDRFCYFCVFFVSYIFYMKVVNLFLPTYFVIFVFFCYIFQDLWQLSICFLWQILLFLCIFCYIFLRSMKVVNLFLVTDFFFFRYIFLTYMKVVNLFLVTGLCWCSHPISLRSLTWLWWIACTWWWNSGYQNCRRESNSWPIISSSMCSSPQPPVNCRYNLIVFTTFSNKPCFSSLDSFLFCWAAFLSISLLASLFLFLRPCLIHARMSDRNG